MVRRGPGKAAVAVGHTLLVTAYYLLLRHDTYRDLDPSLLDQRLRKRTQQRALAQLQALGFDVTLTPHDARRSTIFSRNEQRRMRAADLFRRGVIPAEIARQLGVTHQVVSEWRRRGGRVAERPCAGRVVRDDAPS